MPIALSLELDRQSTSIFSIGELFGRVGYDRMHEFVDYRLGRQAYPPPKAPPRSVFSPCGKHKGMITRQLDNLS
jgi:hypothetical protein